jgi:hypothetical protein
VWAQHARWLEGESPYGRRRRVAPTISRGHGRYREVRSGGSWGQTCSLSTGSGRCLRNTNPKRGREAGRVGKKQRSPMQPRAEAVNWASVQGKATNLPGEMAQGATERAGVSRSRSTTQGLKSGPPNTTSPVG